MSWYERVAGDPKGSLERLAERQGLTVEQLQSRHRRIATVLGTEAEAIHLSASDWRLFRDAPDQLSDTLLTHLDNCAFCKRLGDAFNASAIQERTERTADDAKDVWNKEIYPPESAGVMYFAKPPVSRVASDTPLPRYRQLMVLPMLAVCLVTALVTAGVTTKVTAPEFLASAPMNGSNTIFDSNAFFAVGSGALPAASRPTAPVALLSAAELETSGWEAVCAPNTWTVSQVGQQSMQLTWERQSNEELPQQCQFNDEDASKALAEAVRNAESSSLSVGQNVVVVSPAKPRL